MTRRIVDLPGRIPTRIDANSVVCARVDETENGPFVVLHTDQGFAVGVAPEAEIDIEVFYKEVVSIIWPPVRRSSKARSADE